MKLSSNHSGDNMAKSFTLKNIPDDVYDRVKRRAARNNRSVNGEIISILSAATTPNRLPVEILLARARALRERTRGLITDEFIDRAKREGRP